MVKAFCIGGYFDGDVKQINDYWKEWDVLRFIIPRIATIEWSTSHILPISPMVSEVEEYVLMRWNRANGGQFYFLVLKRLSLYPPAIDVTEGLAKLEKEESYGNRKS